MNLGFDLRGVRTAGLPLLAGAVNGALAFVAAFVVCALMYAVFGMSILTRFAFSVAGGPPPYEEMVGFVFYGAHLVSATSAENTVNVTLTLASGGPLYVLVVGLLLAGTGYYLGAAEWVGSTPLGFVAGATVALGYLPLAAAGATLFETSLVQAEAFSETSSTVLTVPLVEAVVLAGIVFPVLWGGAGGAIAAYRS